MPKKEKELKNECCTDCIIVRTLLRNQSMQNLHIDEEGQQLHANPNKYIICKFV